MSGPESLTEITNELLKRGFIFEFKGEQGSTYLSLTGKDQLIVGRLIQAEEILFSEDSK